MTRTFALLALVAIGRPPMTQAQPPTEPPTTVITLRPAAEPVPALKYRLAPELRSLLPGNAAVFYHRGMHLLTRNRLEPAGPGQGTSLVRSISVEERINDLNNLPIAEVPRAEARKLLDRFSAELREVELGAKRLSCDWEFELRTEGFSLVIPEIQEMRSLARLVQMRVRLAILDGDTDAALHWIETGLVMGRHAADGPIVIQALVGVAISTSMAQCLEDLIQAPGTPSLVWALADRPRPFIDMRRSLEGERFVLETELPKLSELDQGPWGLDQARRFTDELQRKLFPLAAGDPIPGTNVAMPGNLPTMARRLGVAAMAAKVYPEAKRALITRGHPAAEVEAMPVVQVAALYCFQEYQRFRDERYKWMSVPYWKSFDQIDRPILKTVDQKLANPLLALFTMLTPALNAARMVTIRLERRLDAIQCIEAIRLHADAHEGRLPESLEAIKDAPVPDDPATGKPFSYQVEGDSATLSAPLPPGAPNHPSYRIRYVLKPVQ